MSSVLPVAIAIFLRKIAAAQCEMWMQKRREDGPLDGLWEFPGGKIEAGETPLVAMKREIVEEVGLNLTHHEKIQLFKLFPYPYKDRTIALYVYIVELRDVEVPAEKGQWFPVDYETASQPWHSQIPAANHAVIDDLAHYLKQQEGLHSGEISERLWKI